MEEMFLLRMTAARDLLSMSTSAKYTIKVLNSTEREDGH